MVEVTLVEPDGSVTPLGSRPVVVAAADLVLTVQGGTRIAVWLDGTPRSLSRSEPGLLPIDLRRSTGYHRLEVDREVFWFGSTDDKLRLEGLGQLLRELRHLGTGWSGQAMFSDGSLLRDAHVVYGWLDNSADATLDALTAIAAMPTRGRTSVHRLTRRASGRVDVRRTLSLLRVRGLEYLEVDPTGPLEVGTERYTPLRVVERRNRTTLDTPWHRRCAAVAHVLRSLLDEVLRSGPAPAAERRCVGWRQQVQDVIRALPVPAPVGPKLATSLTQHASGPEFSDARYQEVTRQALLLHRSFGWNATQRPLERYSYVDYADAIYQVYVAHRLSALFGLSPTHETFGAGQPVFAGGGFELYHDVQPPADVLRSWRADSVSPDKSRPDLLLRQTASGRVLVIDAKYRAAGNRPTEDSRKEVAAYMSLYGLPAAVIAYPPGDPAVGATKVEGAGNCLLELPVHPGAELDLTIKRTLVELLADPVY